MNHELTSIFAFEIQEAITDVLVAKTLKAIDIHGAKSVLISGGVAANARLREKFNHKLSTINYEPFTINLFAPPPVLCTDNAIYIASCAYFLGKETPLDRINAAPDLEIKN